MIARFTSVDPLANDYAYKTPYDYAENEPVVNIDLDGLEKYRMGAPSEPDNLNWDMENNFFERQPKQNPSIGDGIKKMWWTAKAGGGYIFLPDASKAYLHYLYGQGKDFTFDLGKYFSDDNSGITTLKNLIMDAKEQISGLIQEPGKYQVVSDKFLVGSGEYESRDTDKNWAPYPDSENWQKAIGGFQMWTSADVTVQKLKKNELKYTMKMTFHGSDLYNFNHGDADIRTGSSDDINGDFVIKQLANQFRQYGTYQQTITWIQK
jgi:hypothetical protein